MHNTTLNKRIFGLDLMRCTAILMVVYVHSINMLVTLFTNDITGYLIRKLIAFTFLFGHFGVEIFFALSGYLIGTILIKDYINSKIYNFSQMFHFWKRRWIRTLPLYLFVLIILSICFDFYDIKYFLFIQNLDRRITNGFFPESWSLSIEEWSYITFPILLLCISYIAPKKNVIPLTILLSISIGWILRIHLFFTGVEETRSIVLMRLDAISYGIGIAYLIYTKNKFIIEKKLVLFQISLISLVVLYIFLRLAIPPFDFSKKFILYKFFDQLFTLPIINVCSALMIPYLISRKFNWNLKIKSIITFISKISYSLYLWHFSFLYVFVFHQKLKITNENNFTTILLFTLYITLTFLVSFISYKYIEQPFLKLRDSKNSNKLALLSNNDKY